MTELKYNHLNEEQKGKAEAYILDFLDGYDLEELKISDEKSLVTKVNAKGNFELVLKGQFSPQDYIKNQLAKETLDETTLLEYTTEPRKLIIGTHELVDGVFNDLKHIMRTKIAWSVLKEFEEIAVTKHDFFGKGFVVASLNYPINKFNRVALND